jgi:hypothetical protein
MIRRGIIIPVFEEVMKSEEDSEKPLFPGSQESLPENGWQGAPPTLKEVN